MSQKTSLLLNAVLGGILAASTATLVLSSSAQAQTQPSKVPCYGVNSCKGTGACGGKSHSCAGQNSCKGKGWIKMDKKECTDKGGSLKALPNSD